MRYKKIESIRQIKKYGLPFPETIFIFNLKKQEKEIDNFLKDKKYVAIRTDKAKKADFLPYNLRCHKEKAKKIIKDFSEKGYSVILHKQDHVPYGTVNKGHVSGNIVVLRRHFILELMKGEPLSDLTRKGKLDEYFKINRDDLTEVEHWGKRIMPKRNLNKILHMIEKVPVYKIIEFTVRPEGFYFWQIKDDKTAKRLNKQALPWFSFQ